MERCCIYEIPKKNSAKDGQWLCNREHLLKGKYHCTAYLLFILFKLNEQRTGGHLYSDTSSSVSVLCLVYFPSMTRRHFCIIMILMKKFFSSGTCLSWIQFNFCSSDLQRNKVRLSLWENTSKQKKKFHYLKLTFCCHYYYKIWNESLMYVTGHSAFVTVLIKTWLN